VIERWSWRHCAQLTVDQYREVLAMPENQAKLQRIAAGASAPPARRLAVPGSRTGSR
jgi:hypothetical protein